MTSGKNPLSHLSKFVYPKLKCFKIGQLNITSLVKHIEELLRRRFIYEQPFNILCINETRLDNSISSTEVEISGYEIVRRDRNLISENVEALCLEIRKPKTKPVLVATWYRPPDLNIELLECFEKFLKKIDDENKEITISGDFNCDLLKKDCVNSSIKKMKDLIDIYQLQQHVKKPSRTTYCSQSLIDLILAKIDDTKTTDSGVIVLKISDHSLVYICRKISTPKGKPKLIEARQFKHFNSTSFQNNLREAFSNFDHYTNPNLHVA